MKTTVPSPQPLSTRREFFARLAAGGLAVAGGVRLAAQDAGERPARAADVTVLNPRGRVPVGLIIDDSTCLVNLNRFAMPQFDEAHGGRNPVYHRNWREWPAEIPDAFVRKFGEWCVAHGVKGKYSVVPYPACVGRLDRLLPGWTARELRDSLELVRTLLMPNWDIHPEMVTHTRVVDLRIGHPHPDTSLRFMENWDWTTGKSGDEIAAYQAYALRILKNIGLPCEGVTTPGGYGNRARPQLAQATLESVRDVFGAEIPHYFRDLFDEGTESVAPRVELASGLDGPDPRCVVSILGCTGDWTGGWDNTPPEGADRFITADLQHGRMVDVIQRGEPALMVCHWTGIYWNGQELGFQVFREVVRRLHARFDHLLWMKLSEVARYWAARELTRIERDGSRIKLRAPFACPDFTLRWPAPRNARPLLRGADSVGELAEVNQPLRLEPGKWLRQGDEVTACFALPKGASQLELVS
jgi:hypothetical protein